MGVCEYAFRWFHKEAEPVLRVEWKLGYYIVGLLNVRYLDT